jgi:putative Ca2+/H+ antiporter (TMEM165/GDT1 family)
VVIDAPWFLSGTAVTAFMSEKGSNTQLNTAFMSAKKGETPMVY